MKVEEAKTILEATIGGFKYIQTTLDEDERELYADDVGVEEVQAIETVLQALENSIPKKKVEDKIKTNSLMNLAVTSNPILDKRSRVIQQAKIQVLQELLEGNK